MIKLSDNNIIVSSNISKTTAVIIFNDEEIILTEVDATTFNHTITSYTNDNNQVWTIRYFKNDNYFNDALQRHVLFEKTHVRYGWFSYYYDFYEPIEIIGKGSEIIEYEKLFLEIEQAGGTYIPEKTLLLKRPSKHL